MQTPQKWRLCIALPTTEAGSLPRTWTRPCLLWHRMKQAREERDAFKAEYKAKYQLGGNE